MSGRHPSLEKLSRERLRFQRLAMSSPSDFGTASPMTELAANLNDVAHIMSPDSRRRLSMDSSSPGTPLGTITNLVRNTRKPCSNVVVNTNSNNNNNSISSNNSSSSSSNGGNGSNSGVSSSTSSNSLLCNKENVPITSESEDESSKDSGFCGSSLSSLLIIEESSTSINQTLAELRARPETEPLTSLPDEHDSPSKSDGFDLQDGFDLDDILEEEEEEEVTEQGRGMQSNDKSKTAPTTLLNISTLIHNKVLSPERRKTRPRPNILLSPPHKQPFRRSLSLKERENNVLESPVSSRLPISTFKRPTSPPPSSQSNSSSADRLIKRRKIYDSPKQLNRSLSEVSFSGLISAGLASSSELTGDMSRPVLFPIVPPGSDVKHHDLKPIDSDTLARLIRGEYKEEVESFRIIDARYVYEYEGGHIVGAENFGSWDEAHFFNEFLPYSKSPLSQPYSPESKRKILIFHCEFSSVRGPELMKKLRQKDRCLNRDTYPALHYPECYLLHKGYKEFYRLYPELCEPQAYRSMADPNYQKDAKAFHKKSKSWAGGTVARTRHSSRPLNL